MKRRTREIASPRQKLQAVANCSSGSLFLLLSPELLRLVFEWIGPNDTKAYIRLATCGDRELAHFIYTECTHLWKEIDLAMCPGITDPQLQSLLQRVSANTVTQSILVDKTPNSPITGAGLEPLRHSRVLERIDLRQSTSHDLGPTGLDDELVAGILSTMLPHKLFMVKVRKQLVHDPNGLLFHEYCDSWSALLRNMRLQRALEWANKVCSHCDMPLVRSGHLAVRRFFFQNRSVLCTVCNQYSCRGWNDDSSCPLIEQCRQCLEWCCSCRPMVACDFCSDWNCSECEPTQLTCEVCDHTSCSECKRVRQCKTCHATGCETCRDNIITCDRCHDSFCGWADCGSVDWCDYCDALFCESCLKDERGEPTIYNCASCGFGCCASCYEQYDVAEDFDECSFCGLLACSFDDEYSCLNNHACKSPGEVVYSARDAKEGDEKSSLCACGKKHLESAKGQQFMCAWLRKAEE